MNFFTDPKNRKKIFYVIIAIIIVMFAIDIIASVLDNPQPNVANVIYVDSETGEIIQAGELNTEPIENLETQTPQPRPSIAKSILGIFSSFRIGWSNFIIFMGLMGVLFWIKRKERKPVDELEEQKIYYEDEEE